MDNQHTKTTSYQSTIPDKINSLCQGRIMWGFHVGMPRKLCLKVLTLLHKGHLGVVKMKSPGRSYVWWPSMDSQVARSYTGCHQTQRQPQPASEHTWKWPATLLHHIHVDFAGPFLNQHYRFVSHCGWHPLKWSEIFLVKKKTTAAKIAGLLCALFAHMGLPQWVTTAVRSQEWSSSVSSRTMA